MEDIKRKQLNTINQESFLEEVNFKMCFNPKRVIDWQRRKQKVVQLLNPEEKQSCHKKPGIFPQTNMKK